MIKTPDNVLGFCNFRELIKEDPGQCSGVLSFQRIDKEKPWDNVPGLRYWK
jgi:hypothetical protein